MFVFFIIIALYVGFIIFCLEKANLKSNILYKEKKEEVNKFVQINGQIQGTIVECIIISYEECKKSKMEYFPVIKYLDNNEEKLIACKAVSEFEIFNNFIRYSDLRKRATICIDKNKLNKASIDLENGCFLEKKYSNKRIEIGDYIQARKGVFIRNPKVEAVIYLMEDEHQIDQYINEILISPGIILDINGEDYINKTINNLKLVVNMIRKLFYIPMLIFFIVFIIITLL